MIRVLKTYSTFSSSGCWMDISQISSSLSLFYLSIAIFFVNEYRGLLNNNWNYIWFEFYIKYMWKYLTCWYNVNVNLNWPKLFPRSRYHRKILYVTSFWGWEQHFSVYKNTIRPFDFWKKYFTWNIQGARTRGSPCNIQHSRSQLSTHLAISALTSELSTS